ncbi:MAG: hypothetical protein JNM70_22075 [Anaerolineae bacterium]|nr:hypothetical protein [Anaerolineae bacterium]
MTIRDRLIRLGVGLALLIVLLVVLFSVTTALISTWGATAAEAAAPEPGDDILANPTVRFTNAVTIDAPPEEVWPWIAQIGDTRGGFYSYTFIENRIGALTGAADYTVVYHNAEAIIPEWQNPQPGDAIIQGSLKWRELQPNQYALAESIDPTIMGWTWVWHLYPIDGGQQTRLVSRFLIEPAPGMENPVMGMMMNLGGFVMQLNMLQGIQLRAEGGTEPAWIETVEIVLWFVPLLAGVVAGIAFLVQREWRVPLLVTVAAVVLLFVLTFIQPPLFWRVILDVLIAAGAVWTVIRSRLSPARGEAIRARAAAVG